ITGNKLNDVDGDHCQYQNQRVSLTVKFQNENFNNFAVICIIITLADNTGCIHSHEQLTCIPMHDCNTKFNSYLLYRDRPKDMTISFTVHIDAYSNLLFMSGNRVSAQLIIPVEHQCDLSSDRRCAEQQAHDSAKSHRYEANKSQLSPIDQNQCNCSLDSLCVGIVNNRSICLCPLTKMSPPTFSRFDLQEEYVYE
ncbi:unnamed protein product, partial [Rotaria socialis]